MIKSIWTYGKRLSTRKWLFLLILLSAILNFFFNKVHPIYNGYGYDGLIYGNIAQHFPIIVRYGRQIFEEPWFRRILPPGIVHYGVKLFCGKFEISETVQFFTISPQVIMGFRIMNLVFYVLTGFFMIKILDLLQISRNGKWLAFIGMFISFCTLGHYWFDPVLTDQTALFLGTLTLYAYLKRYNLLLFFLLFINFFTWPAGTYYGLILLAFPRNDQQPQPARSQYLPKLSASAVAVFLLIIIIFIQYIEPLCRYENENLTIGGLVPLSALAALLYMGFGSYCLLNDSRLYRLKEIWRALSLKNALIGVVIFVMLSLVINVVINASPEIMCEGREYNLYNFILYNIRLAVSRPFGFFVSHVFYFGPLLFLTFFFWKSVSRTIQGMGIGLILFFLINLFFSLNSETRQLTWSLPFIVAFTVKGIDHVQWNKGHIFVFLALAVVFSKIWLPKFPPEMDERLTFFYETLLFSEEVDKFIFEFPIQRLNMNYGPWMNDNMYALHGIIMIAVGLLFYFGIVRKLHPRKHRIT